MNAEKMAASWVLYQTKNLQCLYKWYWNVQLILKHRPHNTETGHPGSQLAEGVSVKDLKKNVFTVRCQVFWWLQELMIFSIGLQRH